MSRPRWRDVAADDLHRRFDRFSRLVGDEAMTRLEREFLLGILGRVGGSRRRAAERLQLSYSTLKFRLRKLAITASDDPTTH